MGKEPGRAGGVLGPLAFEPAVVLPGQRRPRDTARVSGDVGQVGKR
jgi:hypothetical protein